MPGLYFAGTLMQARDFKKSTSGFIHGFRYGVRALHRILEQKYHGVAVAAPRARRPTRRRSWTRCIARVNRTSALWQQFGFLGDVIVVDGDGDARYYEELPVDYVHESDFGAAERYFTVTLEYGPDHDQHRPVRHRGRPHRAGRCRARARRPLPAPGGAALPARRARRPSTTSTENLENDWTGADVHREPLRAFFAETAAASAASAREATPMHGARRCASSRADARQRLDPAYYDFFAGGADDEITLRANEAAFARLGLVPRVLRGGGDAATSATTLLGRRLVDAGPGRADRVPPAGPPRRRAAPRRGPPRRPARS